MSDQYIAAWTNLVLDGVSDGYVRIVLLNSPISMMEPLLVDDNGNWFGIKNVAMARRKYP
ncbi:hypothetical protein CSQ89_14615 [Chitinimonas sp. BJB300]|nr:hypothetical protein CSQ89_14615 [Chitinimonas sp. BJB300]